MKPHLTEKSYLLATATKPAFIFKVGPKTTTAEISMLIKQLYGKDVTGVRFVSNAAKRVKRKGITGTASKRRKAIVTLKPGQSIAAFDVPAAESPKEEKKK